MLCEYLVDCPHVQGLSFMRCLTLECSYCKWTQEKGEVTGKIVRAKDSELLLDLGNDSFFRLNIPKRQTPDLLPRVKAALVLASKCLM